MVHVLLLLLFLSASIGVTVAQTCTKSGEMVALQCPQSRRHQKAEVIWSTPQNGDISSGNRTDLLITDGILVLLRASQDLQENYSCSNGVYHKTFDLRVYTTLTGDCENFTQYKTLCNNGKACILHCPTSNTPENITDFTRKSVTWKQNDKTLLKETYYFSSVKKTDQGIYTCVRSFLFHGHVYNMTFTVLLEVHSEETIKQEGIISPHSDEVFFVDIGSPLEINCTAWIFSDYDEVYWKIAKSSINNENLRVYSLANEIIVEGEKMTAPLIFKAVSEDDLSTVFTCKLESTSQISSSVNVTLAQKEHFSYVGVTVPAVVVPFVMIIFVLIYVKYKVPLALFLRDTLGCHRRVADGKSFDAFIMYYTSEQGPGLSGDDRRTLQSVLEDEFGYSLCLLHRNVLPGKAVADAVLECVEQSRAVVLVPASPDLSSESALLTVIHEALVERQTRLIFIRNASTRKTGAPPLSETLQMLTDLGRCVMWQGSLALSSFFWKQLRYYLPPVTQPHKITLLPHGINMEDK